MPNTERLDWIDRANVETLLSKWRFEPSGSPWFAGEVGKHFKATITKRREEVGEAAWTAASKSVEGG